MQQRLAHAEELAAAGHWNQAEEIAKTLLQTSPDGAARRQLGRLTAAIERRRREAVELKPAIAFLASSGRDKVRTAQDRLFEKSEAALPLLREAVSQDDPVLVDNAMQTLCRLGRPEAALPILVEVLANPRQERYWPAAIRYIEAAEAPGAGAPLLKLIQSSNSAPQRIAALEALGRAFDPPPQTVVALLPMLYEDRPELPALLETVAHAIAVLGQADVFSLRAVEGQLTHEQIDQLERLPSRLSQLTAASASPQTVKAARMLATVIRLIPPEPLRGVRVAAVSAEMEGAPATAILDGVWNAVEPTTMWKHPADKRAWVTLDLGDRRTIAGLRIWNLNENGAAHRGWKEIAVHVADAPSGDSVPLATAVVQKAPGIAKAADYFTFVPIPMVRGRYVRLQMVSLWQQDSQAGLTEVQVLGF